MLTGSDSSTQWLLLVLCLFFALFLFSSMVTKLKRFARDLRYINMEIRRNTGSERQYWKKEKRRLWLSLLSFSSK